MSPSLLPIQIYEKYAPTCKAKDVDGICAELVARNLLTPQQVKELKSGSLFSFFDIKSNDENVGMGFVGVELAPFSKPTNCVEKPRQYHSKSSLVEVDEDGKICPEQFDVEEIKRKYSGEDYEISEEKTEETHTLNIYNKKTGENLSYKFDLSSYISNIDVERTLNGQLIETTMLNQDKDTKEFFIFASKKRNVDGSCTYTVFEYKSNNISEVYLFDKIGNGAKAIKYTCYTENTPYKIVSGGFDKNILVNDLVDVIDKFGESDNKENLDNLLATIKRITPKNAFEIVYNYKKQTGEELIDAISAMEDCLVGKGIIGLADYTSEERKEIEEAKQNIKNSLYESSYVPLDLDAEYIVDRFVDDIYGLGSGKLEETIKYVNGSNLESVLLKYRERAREKNLQMGKILPEPLTNRFAPDESLLEAIYNETGLDESTKQDLIIQLLSQISYIENPEALNELCVFGTDFLCSIMEDKYVEDIKADMKLHANDSERLLMDLKRLINRATCKNDIKEVMPPNGKIDTDFEQGRTGDCWLLAGLISMCQKQIGKSFVESMLTVDENTGDVTVRFKGVDKSYTIPYDDIMNSNHLSGGDGDVRAIELAFDCYIKELAYRDEDVMGLDINGNTAEFIYQVLIGHGMAQEKYSKEFMSNFNKQNAFYNLGFSGLDLEDFSILQNALLKENGETTVFHPGHAYAVVKSDDKYVYLINPWDSSEILRATHEVLEKVKPRIGYAFLG